MTTAPAAPDCARCEHPADHHDELGAPGTCYTNTAGEQVPRTRDVECDCPAYSPAADDPECDGVCISGADLGLPYGGIAYPDPECSLHGETTP